MNIEDLLRKGQYALKQSKQLKTYTTPQENKEMVKESQAFFEMQDLIRRAWKEDLFSVYVQEIKQSSFSKK